RRRFPPAGRRRTGYRGVASPRRGPEPRGRPVRAVLGAFLVAALASTASAQHRGGAEEAPVVAAPQPTPLQEEPAPDGPPPKPPEIVSEKEDAVLKERMRDRMHPGDPLEIIGIDEADPSFRRKTPSLVRNV